MSHAVSSPTPPPTLAQALARELAAHASQAFGLMGNGNAHFIEGMRDAGIALTPVRHEAGTVAAADAYTRVSGKLAIATTTYGAGFTNALTALAEAAMARTPMLVVVGDEPSSGPRSWDVDQEMLSAAMGVRTMPLTPTKLEFTVQRAVDYAWRLRRPVVLAIPYDLATAAMPVLSADDFAAAEIDLDDPEVIRALAAATMPRAASKLVSAAHPEPQLSQFDLEAAVNALVNAQRPLVLAGHGAWISGAGAELGKIADVLGALTSTSALCRNIFPRPEFDLGVTGGFGQEQAMAKIAEADVALVVGASLNQFTMSFGETFGEGTTIVRVDLDQVHPPETNHETAHILLQGDAVSVLTQLTEQVQQVREAPSTWRNEATGLEPGGALRVRGDGRDKHPTGICPDGKLDPRAVAAELAVLLPENRHVTTDGGHFIGWTNMFWPVAAPNRMIMVGTAYQAIGLGFPTVAGVAAAEPDTTVVLSTGDGGGIMAVADLETAIRTAKSCVIVVWNDGAYGAEVHLYGRMGINEEPMLIPDLDFAALASSLGAQGVRVNTLDDLAALTEWKDAGATGTILLDCRISREIVAPFQREVQRVNGVEPTQEH